MENNNNQKSTVSAGSFYISDEQYAELKRRDVVIAHWLKAIADKTGVPVDLGQLEKIN